MALSVGPGEWLHVRGANGSGKTTLLRLLAGLAQPAVGEVLWKGKPINESAADYRRDMLFLGHQAGIKDELTPAENLALASQLDSEPLQDTDVLAALRRFGLKGREDLPVRFLSAGQKRRVLLARLATRRARLWVLDEPFTALDAPAVEMLGDCIGTHLAEGGMAVITSHQAVPVSGGRELQL